MEQSSSVFDSHVRTISSTPKSTPAPVDFAASAAPAIPSVDDSSPGANFLRRQQQKAAAEKHAKPTPLNQLEDAEDDLDDSDSSDDADADRSKLALSPYFQMKKVTGPACLIWILSQPN